MRVSKSGGATTIYIDGRFTFTCHKEFREALELVEGPLTVNLFDCQYMDSAALGLLLIARDKIGPITLYRPQGLVKATLEIAAFEKLFTIV